MRSLFTQDDDDEFEDEDDDENEDEEDDDDTAHVSAERSPDCAILIPLL